MQSRRGRTAAAANKRRATESTASLVGINKKLLQGGGPKAVQIARQGAPTHSDVFLELALVTLPVANVLIQHTTPFVWPRRKRVGDNDACADAVFAVAAIHIEVEIVAVADGLHAAVEAADGIRLAQADYVAAQPLIIQIDINPRSKGDVFHAVSYPERRALSASDGKTA